MKDMKVKYEIDVEEVINSLRSNDKDELAEKLAEECLSGAALIELAKKSFTTQEILDCMDEGDIINYMIGRGYRVED